MDIYLNVATRALLLILYLSLLPLLASLTVGVVVSLFQALTQVQEQTLTFVPKVVATILVLVISATFMLNTMINFAKDVFDMMLQVGNGR
ncbi:MAG: flagellar biosynthetic protein FliQ [Pyrinomonadaceae bacterium]